MAGFARCPSQRWCHHLVLIIILSSLWKGSHSQFLPGYILKAPRDVFAQLGLCVHIPCTFTIPEDGNLSQGARGLWYRGSTSPGSLVASKNSSGVNSHIRVILTGNVSEGDCSFSILDVRRSDEAPYQFRIQDERFRMNYQDVKPFVRVTEVTDKPVISLTNNVVAGKEVTLTCMSLGRCSESEQYIGWEWHGSAYLQSLSILGDTVANKNGSTTYYANLTFIPSWRNQMTIKSPDENGTSVSCTINYIYSRKTISVTVSIDVEYPLPNITCSSGCSVDEMSVVRAMEGSSLALLCSAENFPPLALYWMGPDQSVVPASQGGLLTLNKVSLRDEGTYTCQVNNTDWASSNYMTLKIINNPEADADEHLHCSFNESLVECTCVIQSVPFAAFKWVVDPKVYFGNSSNGILSIAMKQLRYLQSSRQKCTSFIKNNYLDPYRKRQTDCVCNINTLLIVGFVVGNILILSLIGVGLLCYIKKSRKNTANGTRSNEVEMKTEGTESNYEVLQHQTHSIYHSLKR